MCLSSINNQSAVAASTSKESRIAAIKRRVTAASINDSVKLSKQRRLMDDVLGETNGAGIFKTKPANNFVNTTTQDVSTDPTDLSNDKLLFKLRSGDKYMHANTAEFLFDVKVQKKDGAQWKDLTAGEKVCVLPNAIVNVLRENLEVRIVHPGEAEDTTVIDLKQDDHRYITRNEIQRYYDKLYCEKELKEPMQLVKELTYPFEFDATSAVAYRPGMPLVAHGLRPRNADIKLADGSILKICEDFGEELKVGKKFSIKASTLDPIFNVPIIPPYHGLNVSMKLGREEDHMKYIEDYTKLAAATTDLPERKRYAEIELFFQSLSV